MPDIKHAIPIDAPPDRVCTLVASGSGFTSWWAADVVVQQSGRVAELGFFNRSTIYRLKLVRAAAPLDAEWLCQTGAEWQNTRLVFQLSQSKAQTLVRFTHAGWQQETDYFIACNTTWGELMYRLKAAAEGKAVGPLFSATGLAY
jgi:uncharacterized protein YndB with AHSA1/START domain